ncbi:MAG: twin-arginine translocation signal domain-containing protein, partial [Pseudomonadota bacterium]
MNQPTNISRRNFVVTSAAAAACAALPGLAGAQSRPSFKVGSLNSITGTGGPYGSGMLEAIKIGIAEVNAAGGAA